MIAHSHRSIVASFQQMDEALKAGIGATAGSLLILALAFLLIRVLPQSTG